MKDIFTAATLALIWAVVLWWIAAETVATY